MCTDRPPPRPLRRPSRVHSHQHILCRLGPLPRDPALAGRRNEATEPHRGRPTGAEKLDPAKPGHDPASPRAEATPAALHLARARGDAGSACARNAAERGNAPPPPSLGRVRTSPAAPPAAAKRGRGRGGPGGGGARVPPCRPGATRGRDGAEQISSSRWALPCLPGSLQL